MFFGFVLDYMLSATASSKLSEEHVNAAYHALLTLSQALPDIAAEQTRLKLNSIQEVLTAKLTGDDTKAWSHLQCVSILQFIASTTQNANAALFFFFLKLILLTQMCIL